MQSHQTLLAILLSLTLGLVPVALAQGGPDVDPSALDPAPAPLPDGEDPTRELQTALVALEALSVSAAVGSDAAADLDDARAIVAKAAAAHADLDRSPASRFTRVLGALRKAERKLARAEAALPAGTERDDVHQVRLDLAAVARLFASDVLASATGAGVDGRRLSKANQLLISGDTELGAGTLFEAIGDWGKAIKTAGGGMKFDLDLFEDNIFFAYLGNVTGVAWVINQKGQPVRQGGFGAARTSDDAPALGMTEHSELNVASVSKTITAVGMLRILQEHGISPDESIVPHLPDYWDIDASIWGLSFRDLMTHHSGLGGFDGSDPSQKCGNTYTALKGCIEDGIFALDQGPYAYQNANFGILRILGAMIEYNQDIETAFDFLDCGLMESTCDQFGASLTSALFLGYMRCEVFEPMNLGEPGVEGCNDGPGVKPSATNPTLAYSTPGTVEDGWLTDDHSNNYGGYGWNMSAYQLAQFLAHLRYSNDVLDQSTRNLMNAGSLGWMDPINFGAWLKGTFATYRMHGGDWLGSGGRQIHTCIADFPQHYQVALVINSQHGLVDFGHQCHQLRVAYDTAWVAK